MRHTAIISLFLCLCSIAKAQKQFQGKISYLLTGGDSAIQVHITAWYKKDKIKFITSILKGPVTGDLKNETIILDFKDSAIDRVKDDRKLVEREMMTGKGAKQDVPPLAVAGNAVILGHPCTGFTSGRFSKEEKKDQSTVVTTGEIKIWYADDLLFAVPDSLKMVQMVPLFSNNRLALGSDIHIQQQDVNIVLHTEAKEIKPMKRISKSIFQYPKDYQFRHNE